MPSNEEFRLITHFGRCCALIMKNRRLGVFHMVCGFFRLRNSHPGVNRAIREAFGRPPEDISWTDAIRRIAGEAEKLPDHVSVPENLPVDSDLHLVIDTAYRADPALSPSAILRAILGSNTVIAADLRAANPVPSTRDRLAASPMLQRLDHAADQRSILQEMLRKEVLGQDRAVEMLGNAFFQACAVDQASGPRGIFTFMGPQGVGKTLLAEAFATALTDLDETPCAFKRFDMSLFTSFSDLPLLYGGPDAGELTGFVDGHPNCVLLFDEVEKALPTLIQSFLPMLDSGTVYDKGLKKSVDFRGAWIIFTTNLGRDYLDKVNLLGDTAAVSAEAFDLLVSAKARTQIKDEDASPVLSPEFVSRISKGGAVIFAKLEARHLLELVEFGLTDYTHSTEEPPSILPAIDASLDAQLLFLLSLLPRLDARRAASRSRAWAMDLIRGVHAELRDDLGTLGKNGFALEVRLSSQARLFLDAKLQNSTQTALLIDEDLRMFHLLEPSLGESGTILHRCTGIEGLEAALDRGKPAFVLLDLNIHKGPSSSQVDVALGILEHLRTKEPNLPVYVFSENPDRRTAFASIAERIMRKGGAREFIPCFRNSAHPFLDESFLAKILDLARNHSLEVLFRNQERGHVQVHFQPRFRFDLPARTAFVELDSVTESVVVTANDISSGPDFEPPPKERFADVIGLERAKGRLAQVLAWIHNPRSLRQFGVEIPAGYLLAGPPGCGKTMLARAFAGEAHLPFIAVDAGELSGKYWGETEARIRDLFQKAREYAPALIFIDELDSIAPDRSRISDDQGQNSRVVAQLLSSMDGFTKGGQQAFVLAATNYPDRIDPAMRRPGRFDEVITLDLPSCKERMEYFRRRLRMVPCAEGVDFADLAGATVGKTPAYLDRLVREAIYLAAKARRERVSLEDFREAKHLVLYGADANLDISPDELELTAHHEAGHAVAQLTLFPNRPIDLITITPNERGILGFVASHRSENQHSLSLREIEDELVMLLAGREAERRLRGDKGVTTGAGNDLERATRLATLAVSAWGFDEEVGPMVLAQGSLSMDVDVSHRVKGMLLAAQEKAKILLEQKMEAHGRIVQELLSQQNLSGDVLRQLI